MVPEQWSSRKMVPGKMVLGKTVLGKMVPENWSPKKWSPENWWNFGMWSIYENPKLDNKPKTRKRKIVEWASSIVVCMCVCVWNVRMRSIYENPKLDNKHNTRKQTIVWWASSIVVCVVELINKNESYLNFLAFFWRRAVFEGHFSGDHFSGDHFSEDHFSRDLFFWGPFQTSIVLFLSVVVLSKTSENSTLCPSRRFSFFS